MNASDETGGLAPPSPPVSSREASDARDARDAPPGRRRERLVRVRIRTVAEATTFGRVPLARSVRSVPTDCWCRSNDVARPFRDAAPTPKLAQFRRNPRPFVPGIGAPLVERSARSAVARSENSIRIRTLAVPGVLVADDLRGHHGRSCVVVFESAVVCTIRQSEERRRDDEMALPRVGRARRWKNVVGSHICRTVVRLEKTAQRGHCRENRRRHARVGDVSRVTNGGSRENETTHRNARNTTAGTSPSPSNPVVG